MKKKLYIVIFSWFLSILISVVWTFENPEKITELKNFFKYKISLGNLIDKSRIKLSGNNYKSERKVNTINIGTAYNFLDLDFYKVPVYSSYGGIESINNNIIYLSGDGDLFILDKKDNNTYKFRKVLIDKISNKKKDFIKTNEPIVGKNAEKYFGIKDIIISNFNETKKLIASSLEYNDKDNCYFVSVYQSNIANNNQENLIFSNWNKIFSTKKCLSVNLTTNPKFAGASAGGRLFKYDNEHILLTIGDFYADGVNGPSLSQDLSNYYGKIIKINITNNNSEIFSFGHRNPQGLYIDKKQQIFSTEHGPTGGDELNEIIYKNNYGWPIATYGTNYKSYDAYEKKVQDSKKEWPLDITRNTHDGYTKPLFSWGNRLGISNLVVYESDYFHKWKDNIIVSTLVTQQLVRLVFDNNKKTILYKENIKIGKRIRDIIVMNNGKIILLTDRGKAINENPEIIIISKTE